jgi:hypothetical protein
MSLEITLSDIYRAYRLTKGVRESVRLTAAHVGRTPLQVCDRLGLDPRWATGPMVQVDYTVTVMSKDKRVAESARYMLSASLGEPAEVRYTPTRAHLIYHKVDTELQ